METTVDINALRNELAREILETDDLGLLERIRERLDQKKGQVLTLEKSEAKANKRDLKPYTMAEIRSWLREAEEEKAAGIPGTPWREMMAEIKEEFPWLGRSRSSQEVG